MAWIPARVRYDERLSPNAKLLYGEIAALTNAYGYCWATNRYFAELYGFTPKSVSALVGQLREAGYIRVEIDKKAEDGHVNVRRIWLSDVPNGTDRGIPFLKDTYPAKKGEGIPRKVKENITSLNNKTPIAPKDVLDRLEAYAGDDKELREALLGYAEMRKNKHQPIATERTLTLLLRNLDKFSGGNRESKIKILDYSTLGSYTGIFVPKDMKAAPTKVVDEEEVPRLD
jgi:hypothetical protein